MLQCGIILGLLSVTIYGAEPLHPLGEFDSHGDVGQVARPGSAEFLPERGEFRLTSSSANIWNKEDAFHFLWKKTSGDFAISMDVDWVGVGKTKHRKACAMLRQSLEADSPYVDVAVHGDGLIALQYRKEKGAITTSVRSAISAPATVKLERKGDLFTVSIAKKGGDFQSIGTTKLALADPAYLGLAICSHNADVAETAIISNVVLKKLP